MIPVSVFILLTVGLAALAAFYFLAGDRGRIPYSDMIAALLGLFGSIFLAVHTAMGNVGYYEAVSGSAAAELVTIPVIDASLAFVFVAGAVLFLSCLVYSFLDIMRERAYERSI